MDNVPSAGQSFGIDSLMNGRYYSIGELFQNVSNGAAVTFVLGNPSGSGKQIYVNPQNIRTEGKAYIQKHFNVSFSGGSSPSTGIVNKNKDASRSSDMNAVINVSSFSNGEQFSSKLAGSSSGGIRAGGTASEPANILGPGDNLLLQVENQADSGSQDFSIDIDWIEISR